MCVSMFSQSWFLRLTVLESNLCTSFKLCCTVVWVFLVKRGEPVQMCALVIINMLGERRESVFLQSQCAAMM